MRILVGEKEGEDKGEGTVGERSTVETETSAEFITREMYESINRGTAEKVNAAAVSRGRLKK